MPNPILVNIVLIADVLTLGIIFLQLIKFHAKVRTIDEYNLTKKAILFQEYIQPLSILAFLMAGINFMTLLLV